MKIINENFRRLTEEAIGAESASIAFSALEKDPSVSVRLNPFKCRPVLDGAEEVPWSEYGFMLPQRPVFTTDPLFHAGVYYVQDSSAMFVGHLLREVLGRFGGRTDVVRVLDLCAAPGGKTTDIAASLRQVFGERFVLVSNEVMKSRATVLADNVAVWGDPNVVVTSADPSAFASLEGFFDIIVADVPCSGEGMFRKDEEAVRQWSEENVRLCAARQKRIVADVWPSLSSGGVFIYSTCTFNRLENDCNVGWIAGELGAEPLPVTDFRSPESVMKTEYGFALIPGLVPGEGQYCAALVKPEGESMVLKPGRNCARVKGMERYESCFSSPVQLRMKGEMLKAVPSAIANEVAFLEEKFRPLATGCAVGIVKGRDLVPSADLPLSILYSGDSFPVEEVGLETALKFLHRDNLPSFGGEKGYKVLSYGGALLGFVKDLGNRSNNLYPQGRRIRMDIKY